MAVCSRQSPEPVRIRGSEGSQRRHRLCSAPRPIRIPFPLRVLHCLILPCILLCGYIPAVHRAGCRSGSSHETTNCDEKGGQAWLTWAKASGSLVAWAMTLTAASTTRKRTCTHHMLVSVPWTVVLWKGLRKSLRSRCRTYFHLCLSVAWRLFICRHEMLRPSAGVDTRAEVIPPKAK